jgi:hypothetical protein
VFFSRRWPTQMTIQSQNLMQVADVVRDTVNLGFRMMSFQPAAQQGDSRRWLSDFSDVAANNGDIVWEQIEAGAGTALPNKLFQMGDPRCNRTSLCGIVGPRDGPVTIVPFFKDECPHDASLRDLVFKDFGSVVLPPRHLALKIARFAVTKFWLLPIVLAWCVRFSRRAGGFRRILRWRVRLITFVMHRFMNAEQTAKAWSLMEAGVTADDPRAAAAGPELLETIERLSSCSYAMAHPDEGRVVPACVQHSVYDAGENIALKQLLPLGEPSRPASDAGLVT